MLMLTRTTLISALLLSSAYAQPAPPPPAGPQPTPMFVPVPVLAPVPVPTNGCVWAGRPFSDGSGFCVADKVMQTCNQGKWGREGASDGCHGALADTK